MPTTVPTFPGQAWATNGSKLAHPKSSSDCNSIYLAFNRVAHHCLLRSKKNSLERNPPCERGDVRTHCGFSLGRLGNALQPRVLFGEGVDRLRAELSEGLPEDQSIEYREIHANGYIIVSAAAVLCAGVPPRITECRRAAVQSSVFYARFATTRNCCANLAGILSAPAMRSAGSMQASQSCGSKLPGRGR